MLIVFSVLREGRNIGWQEHLATSKNLIAGFKKKVWKMCQLYSAKLQHYDVLAGDIVPQVRERLHVQAQLGSALAQRGVRSVYRSSQAGAHHTVSVRVRQLPPNVHVETQSGAPHREGRVWHPGATEFCLQPVHQEVSQSGPPHCTPQKPRRWVE